MLTTYEADRLLKRAWRLQVVPRRTNPAWIQARKGLAAMFIQDHSKLTLPYIELNRLVVAVVYEDDFHPYDCRQMSRAPLRFCGYRAKCVPHGIQWGGVENTLFFKDLTLAPRYFACGQRIDLTKPDLLQLALDTDRCLVEAVCNPSLVSPQVKLPRVWAGFRATRAEELHGDGPELKQACREMGVSSKVALTERQREFEGLRLLPVEFVGTELALATAVFAEWESFPRQQVFRVQRFPEGLTGYTGAMEFDFYHSRFRRLPKDCPFRSSFGEIETSCISDQLNTSTNETRTRETQSSIAV